MFQLVQVSSKCYAPKKTWCSYICVEGYFFTNSSWKTHLLKVLITLKRKMKTKLLVPKKSTIKIIISFIQKCCSTCH